MSNLSGLFRHATNIVTVQAGDKIFAEGQPGDTMYVIQGGSVDILVHGKLVETAEAGSIVGEMALIDNAPRSATAVAKTDCHLVPINQKQFVFMVQETPNFALQVMHIMAQRLRANH